MTDLKQASASLDNYKPLMDERAELAMSKKRIEERIKELDEALRPALVEHGEIIYNGYSFNVTTIPGRTTYDYKAAIADGVDLDPYKKVGKPSTRFVLKPVSEI